MNKLIHETSPYLLQHAHNPVDWYAWKPEAFERAKAENKPILVSIGYSTCHWCHVMERESFEDEATAAMMNEYFINIKVDREERPDVDQIYMEACQIISGNGGWPLNCFLLPDGRPFFAGTYYPPRPAYNRPSWQQVLNNIANAFYNKPDVVKGQAQQLMDIMKNADNNYIKKIDFSNFDIGHTEGGLFKQAIIDSVFRNLQERFDKVEGGFGGAPKFPGTMSIQYLLDYHFYTKNQEAIDHAELSLIKMIQGGIYDQIGGGLARYATDREWLIPHFEKMLYDNALFVSVLSDAFKITKKAIYRETIEETLAFVEREMLSDEGGFYSAYDADSEGVEGKFYVWDKAEIEPILGEDAEIFCQFYDITEGGNWEHKNILWRSKSYETFADLKEIPVDELKSHMKSLREKAFKVREKRIKPGLDDKILLSWNCLMISALTQAYQALGEAHYGDLAIKSIDFIINKFKNNDSGAFYHTYKNGTVQYEAFLEDYALLIESLIDVYSISFDKKYLYLAKDTCEYVITYFKDDTDNLFYFTSSEQQDIPMRKKDLYDNAMPSANSTMARNLLRLGILLDSEDYKEGAYKMLLSLSEVIEKYPSSFAKWASTLLAVLKKPLEIAVVGETAILKAKEINALFLPNKIIAASVEEDTHLPLLKDRSVKGETLIYVCQDYMCLKPVKDITAFQTLIKST